MAENTEQENANGPSEDLPAYDPKMDLPTYAYPSIDEAPEMMRPLIAAIGEGKMRYGLPLLLGMGTPPLFRELYNHPNVLLAGTIASGKTQFIYNQLVCWMHTHHPAELKFVICRSKPVDYNSIANVECHFLAKVPGSASTISQGTGVVDAIESLVMECDARLELFRKAGLKTIADYNDLFTKRQLDPENGHRFLPNIVLVMDDLNTFLDDRATAALVRLTQQNLYTGIYLIAATSQIMARTISPQLRANFSVRLAMKLMSQNESRKILDRVGAEKLVPQGELLYEESGKLLKATQPFIDYQAILSLAEAIGCQPGYPSAMLLPAQYEGETQIDDFDITNRDSMFEDAARLVVLHQQGSTSLIQRKLKLGYNRAGRIIDQLEAAGIVGPFEGSSAREVLFPDEYSLKQFLKGLKVDDSPKAAPHKQAASKAEPIMSTPPKRVSHKKAAQFRRTIYTQTSKAKDSSPPVSVKTDQKTTRGVSIWIILIALGILLYVLIS